MKRKSVARKQARSKSKARLEAKRPPARTKKKAATREGGTRPPTVGPTPASPAAPKPEPTGPTRIVGQGRTEAPRSEPRRVSPL
jgi:hypothetical protein